MILEKPMKDRCVLEVICTLKIKFGDFIYWREYSLPILLRSILMAALKIILTENSLFSRATNSCSDKCEMRLMLLSQSVTLYWENRLFARKPK